MRVVNMKQQMWLTIWNRSEGYDEETIRGQECKVRIRRFNHRGDCPENGNNLSMIDWKEDRRKEKKRENEKKRSEKTYEGDRGEQWIGQKKKGEEAVMKRRAVDLTEEERRGSGNDIDGN